jgi:o-succinylbenzoate---CoA ligase
MASEVRAATRSEQNQRSDRKVVTKTAMSRRLVVIEAHGTPQFVDALQRAWDGGDAVLPLDPRLPPAARRQVLDAARPHEPCEEGDALVIATSGTTGPPKAAVLTHEAVAASAQATSRRLGVHPDRDRWLACLPLAHVGGLGVVTRALHTGVPLTVVDRADAATLSAAARRGCTLVSLVPTLLARIDPGDFRIILLGGSAMPPDLPANAVTTYGMTETGGGVVYDGTPLDEVDVRVRAGEVYVRGPMLLRAYRDGTDPKDPDGWLATGDAGNWDPTTRTLRVTGRLAELIITGGENVWPATVEERLAAHPAVREVLVFGRDDPTWGQRVVARVVPADPDDPPTLDTLRGFVKQTLPAWAAPAEVEIVDALPRTALGKPRRS